MTASSDAQVSTKTIELHHGSRVLCRTTVFSYCERISVPHAGLHGFDSMPKDCTHMADAAMARGDLD